MLYHKQEDMAKYSDAEVQLFRRKVGVVFQDYKLIERKTVIENIMYPLAIINSPL
jgi:cell division transport system ATP-binding protein